MTADLYQAASKAWETREWTADGLRLVQTPARSSGYEAARVIWHVDPDAAADRAHLPRLAFETVIRSPLSPTIPSPAEWLESRGVCAEPSRTHTSFAVEVRGPKGEVRESIRMLAAAFLAGNQTPDALRAAKSALLSAFEKRDRSLPEQAERSLLTALAGVGSWLGLPDEGTVEAVHAAGADDVEGESAALTSAYPISVVYADDSAHEVWLGEFSGLAAEGMSSLRPSASLVRDGLPSRVEISVPGLRGAFVLCGRLAAIGDADDPTDMEIAAHALGGWGRARWQALFREDKGLTYGIVSRFRPFRAGRQYSLTTLGMSVAKADAGQAAALLEAEAHRFARHGLTRDECVSSAELLIRGEALYADSARKLSARTAQPFQAGLDGDFARRRMERLAAVRSDEAVNARLRTLRAPMVIVSAIGEAD